MRVAIVNGGIGGMALALSLHDAGFHDVNVYGSVARVKERGVGISGDLALGVGTSWLA